MHISPRTKNENNAQQIPICMLKRLFWGKRLVFWVSEHFILTLDAETGFAVSMLMSGRVMACGSFTVQSRESTVSVVVVEVAVAVAVDGIS